MQQGATGASAKSRLTLLKSLLKIDFGPKGLENTIFFRGLGPLDTQWGVTPGPTLWDGALRLASLGQLHPQDENLATALHQSQFVFKISDTLQLIWKHPLAVVLDVQEVQKLAGTLLVSI